MSHLSQEEKARLIEAGAAKRQERFEKRRKLKVENNNQSLVSADAFHKGLKKRLAEMSHHLYCVIFRGEQLNMELIPQIVDLFYFQSELDACIAYKMCEEDYQRLITKCWYFQRGKSAVLSKTAFEFWDKVLSFPEIRPGGTVILNILAAGQINELTFEILKKYHKKFEVDGVVPVIANQCEKFLKDGGVKLPLSDEAKLWNDEQKSMLQELVQLYRGFDTRTLEEIAEDILD